MIWRESAYSFINSLVKMFSAGRTNLLHKSEIWPKVCLAGRESCLAGRETLKSCELCMFRCYKFTVACSLINKEYLCHPKGDHCL